MADVSGVDNLTPDSDGSDSLAGIKSAVDNLNADKAEVGGQVFTGNISAPNLSGTNTGDQTLPTDATLSTSDVTTNNASTSKHGFLKKLSNLATDFMNGQGAWASVKDSDLSTSDVTTNNVSTSKHGFAPKGTNTGVEFLRDDGIYAVPAVSPPVPNWVDEGSLTFANSSADQTLTFANAGKDLYMVIVDFTAGAGTLAIQLNGISAGNYSYAYQQSATTGGATAQTALNFVSGGIVGNLGGVIYMRGKHNSGSKSVAATILAEYAATKLLNGVLTGDSNNLSSIKVLVGGSAVTGVVHVYSLNL